uniref:Putative secreted protein n=1 Tax=Anopheles darlingi TaxID=43151 RepID=A0A2M4D3Q3_ANODA
MSVAWVVSLASPINAAEVFTLSLLDPSSACAVQAIKGFTVSFPVRLASNGSKLAVVLTISLESVNGKYP